MSKKKADITVTPVHLPSLSAIAKTFSVGAMTVRGWYKQGAPIAFERGRYSAEYNALQAWRVSKHDNS